MDAVAFRNCTSTVRCTFTNLRVRVQVTDTWQSSKQTARVTHTKVTHTKIRKKEINKKKQKQKERKKKPPQRLKERKHTSVGILNCKIQFIFPTLHIDHHGLATRAVKREVAEHLAAIHAPNGPISRQNTTTRHAIYSALRCAVLCCAVLCCAVLLCCP